MANTSVLCRRFWDPMDVLPVEATPKIEAELLRKVHQHYPPEHDTLLFDAMTPPTSSPSSPPPIGDARLHNADSSDRKAMIRDQCA